MLHGGRRDGGRCVFELNQMGPEKEVFSSGFRRVQSSRSDSQGAGVHAPRRLKKPGGEVTDASGAAPRSLDSGKQLGSGVWD